MLNNYTLRLSNELRAKLKELARKSGLSMTSYVRMKLTEVVDVEEGTTIISETQTGSSAPEDDTFGIL